MQALEDTIAALGTPLLLRTLGTASASIAAIARWRHGATVVEVAPSNTIRLAMSLVDTPTARDRTGTMAADRAGGASISVFSPTEGVSVDVRGEADIVQLFLDQSSAHAILDTAFACPPMLGLLDDWMRGMVMRILVGSVRQGPDDALQMDENLLALALRLERHSNRWRSRPETSQAMFRGGLAPAAFRRIEGLMSTALDEATSPSLAKMAETAGLSVTHFARAFRRHIGDTPHSYLVRRRMDRAVSLLRGGKLPVAEVADKVGFSTTAHFVATFRTTMGVTPGALRDALAG
jgi:AraC family transcriptional regulator